MRTPGQRVRRPAGALVASLLLLLPAWTSAAGGANAPGPAAGERAVLLQLYALDSGLARARSELTAAESSLAAVEEERREVQLELRAARRTLAIAQRNLGGQVRVLYEHDEPDVLAVVFGASSLDELLTGLDGLSRAAGATSTVVAQAGEARARVERTSRALAGRRRALEALRSAAAARLQELERAQAERRAYLGRLREQARLSAAQIAAAEARAKAARAASETATVLARAAGNVASFAGAAVVAQSADRAVRPASGQRLTVLATAYSLPGSTASGLPVGPGIVAVDPTVIPMGTRMTIPGYGEGVAADVGTAIKGLRIDLWFPTLAQARGWGLRRVTITLH